MKRLSPAAIVGIEDRVEDLLGIGVAQGIGVDLVLDGFLGGCELFRALVVDSALVNSVSSPSHEARHGGADHDTSKHPRLSLNKFPTLRAVKVCFDYGSSLRAVGSK